VKPILCSLSDVAASGGYFIAAGCDMIFAEPMTITGSIGIFYGKFDVSGLAAKLGITTETRTRGAHADVESLYRPYTEDERKLLLEKLRYMYGRFIGAVAEGRKLTKAQVDDRGRGHVYTAAMAERIQLVDKLGGLGDAIDEAKRRIGVDQDTRVQLIELPSKPASLFSVVGRLLGASAQAPLAVTDLPFVQALLRGLPGSILVAPEGAQARLPYEIGFD
jgi:protease IV